MKKLITSSQKKPRRAPSLKETKFKLQSGNLLRLVFALHLLQEPFGKAFSPIPGENRKKHIPKLKTIINCSIVMAQGTSKAWSDSDPPALCRCSGKSGKSGILGGSEPGNPNFVDLGGSVRGCIWCKHLHNLHSLSVPRGLGARKITGASAKPIANCDSSTKCWSGRILHSIWPWSEQKGRDSHQQRKLMEIGCVHRQDDDHPWKNWTHHTDMEQRLNAFPCCSQMMSDKNPTKKLRKRNIATNPRPAPPVPSGKDG